jgi:hypothetical protein
MLHQTFLEDVKTQMDRRRIKLIVKLANVMGDYDLCVGRENVIKTYSLICEHVQ